MTAEKELKLPMELEMLIESLVFGIVWYLFGKYQLGKSLVFGIPPLRGYPLPFTLYLMR